MIKSISTRNIYNVINNLDLCDGLTVYNQKPIERLTTNDIYLFMSKVSDLPAYNSNKWVIQKVARISFTIFSKASLFGDEDHQELLEGIVSDITNSITKQDCLPINDWDWVNVCDIQEDTISPIIYTGKWRPYVVKDYLFTYTSQ